MSAIFEFCCRNLAINPIRQITYAWDDWHYTDYFYFSSDAEFDSVEQISEFGNRALCIAIGEWICAQLRQIAQHVDALNFFDAAWVTIVKQHTCGYVAINRKDCPGPLLGPLRAAMLIVNDTIFDAEEDFDFSSRSCWAINLARHIAEPERRDIFESWLQEVLYRLSRYHQSNGELTAKSIFDEQFDFGAPVAPSLFVTDRPYDPSTAVAEITALAKAMQGTNPYLETGEESDDE